MFRVLKRRVGRESLWTPMVQLTLNGNGQIGSFRKDCVCKYIRCTASMDNVDKLGSAYMLNEIHMTRRTILLRAWQEEEKIERWKAFSWTLSPALTEKWVLHEELSLNVQYIDLTGFCKYSKLTNSMNVLGLSHVSTKCASGACGRCH